MVWLRHIQDTTRIQDRDLAVVVGAARGPRNTLGTTLMRRSLIPAKGNARGRVVTASVPGAKRTHMCIPHNATVLARVGVMFLWNALERPVLEGSSIPL